jgi:TonB family protein
MRNAILISLLFHLSVYYISTRVVRFARVNYIPRQVYSVSLFSMQEAKKVMEKEEHPRQDMVTKVEPEKPKEESMPPPPDESSLIKVKKKPTKKTPEIKKKSVPSSEINNGARPQDEVPASSTENGESRAATGDMRLDTRDFPFAYYLMTIRRKVAGTWNVPQSSVGGELQCRVHFRIARDGQIVSPEIELSSGVFLFDQAALRAVIEASPMPPLPDEYRGDNLGVHFSFAFEER